MENRNTIIALVLMLAVWIGFSLLSPPRKTPVAPPARNQQAAPTAPKASAGPMQGDSAGNILPAPAVKMPATSIQKREITVETADFTAVFTNSGGRLKSLVLKKYHQKPDPKSARISVITPGPEQFATLRTSGTESLGVPADALYAVDTKQDLIHLGADESRQLVFTAQTASGAVIQKIFTLKGDKYTFGLQIKVINRGNTPVRGSIELALVHPWDKSMKGGHYDFIGPATLAGDKVHTEKVPDLAKEPATYSKDVVWSAFETKYFMGAVIPLHGAADKVQVASVDNTLQNKTSAITVENTLSSPYLTIGPQREAQLNYLLYFGPRDLDILKSVDHQLNKIIDFGFFGIIARPLLHVLNFFYSYVGNYGVAIILLTIIIKIIFWPLTQKSYTSMKAMQVLQPQMAKIREKHKNDKERMNREIMELYKKHRVNPLGGCLPMVIQIPVFFALYRVLLGNIALRHAPFAFWLTDLSVKDPYYITPLIMGVTMFVQQKMTPTSMDPKQAKMMMAMPVVFTFLFLNFPSGLVIYWLVNNLLTILQQYFINRKATV